jgi:hypothetical protein
MSVYSYYGLFCVLAVVAVFAGYRALRHRGRLPAAVLSLSVLALLTLLYPIPVHGGFTFLAEILIEEWAAHRRSEGDRAVQRAEAAFVARLEARFAGPLAFRILDRAPGGWARVATDEGTEGWYERKSRLIWTDMLPWPDAPASPPLEGAVAFCNAVPPQGYWTLPTEGELYFFWKAEGAAISPGRGYSSMAFMVDTGLQMELPTVFRGTRAGYTLRCVARSPKAPEAGYTRDDVELGAWNAFQIRKAELY